MADIRIDGIQKTLTAWGKATKKDADAIEDVLFAGGETIGKKADYYVPVDEGDLKKSKRVEKTGKGFGTKVNVAYGGPSAPHAMIVHEAPEMVHAPPTCFKYLERATRESRGTLAAMVKRRMAGRNLTVSPATKTSTHGYEE